MLEAPASTRPAERVARRTSVDTVAAARTTVTLIPGDGVGPEITAGARRVLRAAGVPLGWEVCAAGESAFSAGIASGVPDETIASIRRNRVVLKGPLATPVGHGGKSANVTLRKLFETYANVRPARELPGVPTPYAGRGIDFLVVRENVEDLYAAIEHMQSRDVAQALKLVTRTGSEKVIRHAFELARAEGRKSVHCATKANILKLTEGLFKRVFEEVACDYPEIRAEHVIVDNCAHLMAMRPERFEVIVTTNLQGDILSDLASGLVGGLGFASSANVGTDVAIFEAVHGSAPDIAGRGVANPTAMLLSAVMMLRHLGMLAHAAMIESALLSVLERGEVRTADFGHGACASTSQFVDAVIDALGTQPDTVVLRAHRPIPPRARARIPSRPDTGTPVGVDVFIASDLMPETLGARLVELCESLPLGLKMISNRGVQVYPTKGVIPDLVDVYRCRFVCKAAGSTATDDAILELLRCIAPGLRWMHVEKLQHFADATGFTKAQGEN